MRDSDKLAFITFLSSLIGEHTPSLSDQDEEDITTAMYEHLSAGFVPGQSYDVADLAKRTCSCGVRIDGFYEYLDHLKEMAAK